MAHCLGCFKAMVVGASAGPLPSPAVRSEWLLIQGKDLIDGSFVNVLLEQFVSAAKQLEHIADYFRISPLELTLDNLIRFIENHEKFWKSIFFEFCDPKEKPLKQKNLNFWN